MSNKEKTSLERALLALGAARDLITVAESELGQLDRCTHSDYPFGTPPLKRCVLKSGHAGQHRYPELHHAHGGRTMSDLDPSDQIKAIRGEDLEGER